MSKMVFVTAATAAKVHARTNPLPGLGIKSPLRASHVNTTKQIQDKPTSRTVFHRYFKKCELSNKIEQRNAGIKTQAKLVVARESESNCHDKISNPVAKVEPA